MRLTLSILGAFLLGCAWGHHDRRPCIIVEVLTGKEAARFKLRNPLNALQRAN